MIRGGRRRTDRFLFIGLVGLLTTVPSCGMRLSEVNIIDTQTEIQLGSDFAGEIEKELVLIEEPLVAGYVDSLGQLLARHSRRADIPYHIKVVDTDDVNAFALPGGFLYVNRGLITTAENEMELAGVMAHEVSHVVARHGAKQLTRTYGISIVASLTLGENPELWHELVTDLLASGTLLHYGREAEYEADRLGAENMHAAGFDPEGLPVFFEKLLDLHEREPRGLELLFSTHPPTRERITEVRAVIASLEPRRGLTRDSHRFHRVQEHLRAQYSSQDEPGT